VRDHGPQLLRTFIGEACVVHPAPLCAHESSSTLTSINCFACGHR
jgi:hypothetical protein